MEIEETRLSGVFVIRPRVHGDARGFFMETFRVSSFAEAGLLDHFVQDNHSRSSRGTLRGLHYQQPHPQGKLLWATRGEIFDVVVDLRQSSPTCGEWVGVHLNCDNRKQIYVPPGCAHGFCVLSDVAEVVYKCTEEYHPEHEHSIRWDDPDLGIDWPIDSPTLSVRDEQGLRFQDAPKFD